MLRLPHKMTLSRCPRPATRFARCHDPDSTIRTKRATPHVQSATPATQNDDGGLQSAAPAKKNATPLLITSQMYCACHTERLVSPHETCCDVTKCQSATPATRNKVAQHLTSKVTIFAGDSPEARPDLIRMAANGCGRLRTVTNGCATSSEHTLNPQTPRVKREPLLCIRENQGEQGETAGSTLVISPNKKKWISCKIQKVKVSQNTPKILHL